MEERPRNIVQKIFLFFIVLSLFSDILSTEGASSSITTSCSTEKTHSEMEINSDQPVEVTQRNIPFKYAFQCTIHFSIKDFCFEKLLGYDRVIMKNGSSLNEVGDPMLPIKPIMIALPDNITATTLQILSTKEQVVPGIYTIFPAQKIRPVGDTSNSNLFDYPHRATSTSPIPYPSHLALLENQTDLAGQSMIEVTIFPLRYLPAQKTLTLIESISLVIEGSAGHVCGDYLPRSLSESSQMMYEQMIKGMVINPQDVVLHSSPDQHSLGVQPGDYDYVIITKDSWASAFQPLADWKTKKGVPATIVTTSWIYNSGGYSGTDVQKIKAFVQDVYNTWGTTYVLLGGDTDVVPCHYRTFSGVDPDPVPNDAYYADFDSDWMCEVNVGRASVTGPGNGTGQIGNFINKVLTYETDPPANYVKKAGFFGFDLDSLTHAQQCKININTSFVPTSWTVKTVYDTMGGNHRTDVINALNAGQHLVNHADHSNSDSMGTGYYHHSWLIYSSDMDAVTNGNKQTIFYSMGCDPAAYDSTNCIAEHFVRNSNGGGIAFIGNSRYGWYQYATYNTLSMGYDAHFFKSLFQENLYTLGAAFSDHKNDGYQEYPGDEYYQYCYTELTLLGDPELPVWTENPTTVTVTHPSQVPIGTSSFYVSVSSGGIPISQAYVCLWKGNEVYQRGYTDATGNITFTVSPSTSGTMNVTVTKHNYRPNKSTVQVIENNLPPNQPSSPDPASGAINVSVFSDLHWTGGDPNPGDMVTYDVYLGTTSTPSKVLSNQSVTTYTPGILNYTTHYYWKIVAWDTHGASTTGELWQFTTMRRHSVITNLSSNWNFLSLPFNQSIEKWNLSITCDGIEYSWQEAVNHHVILGSIFGWNRTNQNYELVDLLIPGQGHWMYAYYDCEISAVGVNGLEPDIYITDLLQNWNLMGSSNNNSAEKQNLLIRCNETTYTWQDAVTNAIILGFIYEWNGTNQAYQLSDVFQPGHSYWMYAYHGCTLLRPMD